MRDALLSVPHDDLDFATDARPEEIKQVVRPMADAIYTMGERFGTIGVRVDGHIYEITTFRDEIYHPDSRKPEVTFSSDIETDLSRRDFTINAMALDVRDATMIDPFDGLADLARRELRTPVGPEISFSDDPLRMLRLFRFASSLTFEPSADTIRAVERMGKRMSIVSAERVRDELSKLLLAEDPVPGLRGMVDTGLTEHVVPELLELKDQHDPFHRHKDVWEHTLAVVSKTEPRLRLRMAALLHDIGKPATREFGEHGVSFHHHEVVGSRLAKKRLRDLRYPNDFVAEVAQLVFLHLRPHTFKMGWTDSAVRRYVRDAGPLLDDLNQLVRCDVTTRNQRRASAIQRRIDELEERIEVLAAQEELSKLRPPIDGHDVMTYLGIEPGPAVGEVMRMLLEHRIDHGPYTEDEAYALIDEWRTDAEE